MPTNTGEIEAFYAGLTPVEKLYAGSSEIWLSGPGGPVFVGAGAVGGGSNGGHTIAAPADSLEGDELFIWAINANNGAAPTVSGWSLVSAVTKSAVVHSGLWRRTATGSGAANDASVIVNSFNRGYFVMLAVRGGVTTVDTVAHGFSANIGFSWASNVLTVPCAAHASGLMLGFSGSLTEASARGASVYSNGLTEVVDFWTASGDKYSISAAHGTTTGDVVSPFTVTNVGDAAFYTHGGLFVLS